MSPADAAQELNLQPGSKALITTNEWFYAPNGRHYKAVFGTIKAARTAEASLGIRPNGKSANWYLEIGNMTIAGCQIHYAVRCDSCEFGRADDWATKDGGLVEFKRPCTIYNADLEAVGEEPPFPPNQIVA